MKYLKLSNVINAGVARIYALVLIKMPRIHIYIPVCCSSQPCMFKQVTSLLGILSCSNIIVLLACMGSYLVI